MALLAIHDPRTSLSFRKSCWTVLRGPNVVRSIRAHEIDEIHLYGAVDLTVRARSAALAADLPVVFLTRDGRYRGRLTPRAGAHVRRALAQLRWLGEEPHRVALAREIVRGKVRNQRQHLVRVQSRRPADEIAAAAAAQRLLLARLDAATTLDELRGIEGAAAARYFGVWAHLLLHPRLRWSGRNRRPPRDPVNACLGFGYAILANRVRWAVLKAGLLPTLGALHDITRDQEALVFDLIEELRTIVVDAPVVRLINRRQLDVEDFEDPRLRRPDFDPFPAESEEDHRTVVYLAQSGRTVMLTEVNRRWSERIEDHLEPGSRRTIGDLLDRQVRQLAQLFEGRIDRYQSIPHP